MEGWIDEMKDNRMDNIVECAYNMDNGYVEVWFTEDDMVKGMFGTIVQGYLKKGYNRATAEIMAREFFRYES